MLRDVLKTKFGKVVLIEIAEWGQPAYLRTWSAGERLDFVEWHESNDKAKAQFMFRVVVMSVCDELGNKVFTLDDMDDLRNQPGDVITKIVKSALDLNGLSPDSAEESKKN